MNLKTISILVACVFLSSVPGMPRASFGKDIMGQGGLAQVDAAPQGTSRSTLGKLADRLGLGSGYADGGITPTSRETMEKRVESCLGSRIDTITVAGNTKTKTYAILREMATKQGDELVFEKIMRDYSYLRGLGFFSRVEIEVEKTSPSGCRVKVTVEDRPDLFMKYPFPILNYDFDNGISYGMRWRVKNFRGVGEDLLLSFEKLREKEHSGGVYWSIPWTAGHRIRMASWFFTYKRLEIPDDGEFIKERNGLSLLFGLPLSDDLVRQVWLTPEISFEDRFSRLSTEEDPAEPQGVIFRQKFLSVGATLSLDSRDKMIAPTRGVFAAFRVRKFSSVTGLQQQYTFFHLTGSTYVPVGKFGTVIAALRSYDRDGELPSFYKLGLGGKDDVRGYDDGGRRERTKVTGTLQWRKQVFGPVVWRIPLIGSFDVAVNSVLFIDSGALMDGFKEMGDSRFHTSGGFGLEILSPVQDMIRIEAAKASGTPLVVYVTSILLF